jgi:parallel beta-helix repeat protein
MVMALWTGAIVASAAAEPPRGAVNVADFAKRKSFTGGIQEAIDALPPSGGVVTIPAGEYALRQSIRLRSNVTLQGAGPKTILRKAKQAESKLAAVEKGSRSVQVENAGGFSEGDEVGIRDKEAMGWNVAHAIVKEVRGNELLLDRSLPRTYDPAKMGFVIHAFPAITANGASRIVVKDLAIKDDTVRDLAVHGSLDTNNPRVRFALSLPFTFAAMHFADLTDSRIEECQVVGWLSDGISLQRGANNTLMRCLAQNCGGKGFHPGGGLHDSVFSHNEARGNGDDGLYFCAKVQRVTVSDNEFIGNKGNGVGGLGDSGDRYNTVTNNVCAENGANGIQLCDGDNNKVINNICRNNSQSAPGRYSGIFLNKTAESVVTGNRCFDDQQIKTQAHGIQELPNCRSNIISNNMCRGNAQSGLDLAGNATEHSGNVE